MLELNGATLTYEEFRRQCLEPNRPAIIRCAWQSGNTVCFDLARLIQRLSPQSLCRSIGAQTLVPVYPMPSTVRVASTHGGETAPVALACPCGSAAADDCHDAEDVDADGEDGCCTDAPLRTVLDSWRREQYSQSSSSSAAGAVPARRVYYLKDWHLQAALEASAASAAATSPSEFAACREKGVHGDHLYEVPAFLGADWMDAFCRHVDEQAASGVASPSPPLSSPAQPTTLADRMPHTGFGNGRSDYRFCYMGPVGSWTPLHCDVFGTYSWSFNVCGDKLWYFPTVSGNAYLHAHLLPYFPTPPDMRVLTGFAWEAVVQHPGDLVFVPALFYHQVHNITGEVFPAGVPDNGAVALEEGVGVRDARPRALGSHGELGPLTISLNHNWCNAFNAETMAQAFLRDASRLTSSLSPDDLRIVCDTDDVEVWRRHVDAMLLTGTNWSYACMTAFLSFCVAHVKSASLSSTALTEKAKGDVATVARLQRLLDEVTRSRQGMFQP